MGGLLIVIAIVVPTLLWADLRIASCGSQFFRRCAYAAIGFSDDYSKVAHRRNLGLTARAKLGLQIATSIVIASMLIAMQTYGMYSTKLIVPFFKQYHPDLVVQSWEHFPHVWPLAFLPFMVFVTLYDRGLEQCGESHRRPRWTGDRLYGDRSGRADGADIRQRPRDVCDVSGTPTHAAGGRVDDFLWGDGRSVNRISLVQRASRGSVYGRRGIAGPGRRHRHGRRHHQAGVTAAVSLAAYL